MTAPRRLVIRIPGQAIPQGSKTVYWKSRSVVDANPQLPAWRAAVTYAARQELARQNATAPMDGPVSVDLVFLLKRPPSAPKQRNWPTVKPDLDKLIRAVLDGLTDARVWTDDARAVTITASKRYAEPDGNPSTFAYITDAETTPEQDPKCG